MGFRIEVGSGTERVDLAIFPEGAAHTRENIAVIVEAEKQGTKREDKEDGVGRMKSYLAARPNAERGGRPRRPPWPLRLVLVPLVGKAAPWNLMLDAIIPPTSRTPRCGGTRT